VVEKTRV
jgi:septal ring factor EnvC (AmiA/AmiB activator)